MARDPSGLPVAVRLAGPVHAPLTEEAVAALVDAVAKNIETAPGDAPGSLPADPAPQESADPQETGEAEDGAPLPVTREPAPADIPAPESDAVASPVTVLVVRRGEGHGSAEVPAEAPAASRAGDEAAPAQSSSWTPADDLLLAQGAAMGDPMALLADALGREPAAVKARWAVLNPERLRPADLGPLLAEMEARTTRALIGHST